ncbi:MAG: molecular chaperone [Alphaproteobacteria bacterium]|nr:molecular chaperone [Alphaproteobacteria bacterium]
MKTAYGVLIIWLSICSSALADIEVSPLRHVITAKAREATIAVSNPSHRVLDARVSWVDLTATETGYAPAEKQARKLLSAAPYLIVSPAFFQLEPGGRIEITVKLRDGVTPPQGERRSHLLIETAASRTPIRKASANGLQVDIGLSISTPVILRNGDHAAARIGETKLLRDDDGMLLLATAIEPAGVISTFGRLTATFKPHGEDGVVQALGIRDNVAGYLDAPKRMVEIPLGYESLGEGELTLRYEGAAEFTGQTFDERKFDIAPPE